MTDKARLKHLKIELQDMIEYHSDISKLYGSELCAGDMIRKERLLKEQIEILEEEIETERKNDIIHMYRTMNNEEKE